MIDHSVVRPLETSEMIKSKVGFSNSKGMPKRVLLVDMDEETQERRATMLRLRAVEVTCADDIEHARLLWQEDTYSLVMIDATGIQDDAMAFCKSIKDKRPKQMVKFLVGRPGLLADSPLEDEIPMLAGQKISVVKSVHPAPGGSGKHSPGIGIKGASLQILKCNSLDGLQPLEQSAPKAVKELSFGDAIRRVGGH